ncbi:MAG: protein-glutamate O-methyltransferase CheR [Bacillota bacterium]
MNPRQNAHNFQSEEDTSYAYLCRRLRELGGMDLAAYKSAQVQRRLNSFLERHRLPNLIALARSLDDPQRLEELKIFLTINVSEFFRNPERFLELQDQVMPHLPPGGVRVWSAGCANGAEPYTLAMIIQKARPNVEHHVWATDIDGPSLAKAEAALFGPQDVKSVPRGFLRSSFVQEGQVYRVHPRVRRLVQFARHDLLRDEFPTGYHLVVCRNVLIYFTEEARAKVCMGFRQALVPGGFLFMGGTETLLNPPAFGFAQFRPFFYRAV